MKKLQKYDTPSISIYTFECEDIITASAGFSKGNNLATAGSGMWDNSWGADQANLNDLTNKE